MSCLSSSLCEARLMTLYARVMSWWTVSPGGIADKNLSKNLSNIMEAIQRGGGKITSLTSQLQAFQLQAINQGVILYLIQYESPAYIDV